MNKYNLVYETDSGDIVFLRKIYQGADRGLYERDNLKKFTRYWIEHNLTFIKRLQEKEKTLYRWETVTTPNGFTFKKRIKVN